MLGLKVQTFGPAQVSQGIRQCFAVWQVEEAELEVAAALRAQEAMVVEETVEGQVLQPFGLVTQNSWSLTHGQQKSLRLLP